jgi:hypothetical protein
MNVVITEITPLSECKYLVSMAVDGLTIDSEIIESSDPIRYFNFGNLAFKDVLEMAGQLTLFLRGYWQFRDDSGEPLPWDFGCYDSIQVERALKKHGLRK